MLSDSDVLESLTHEQFRAFCRLSLEQRDCYMLSRLFYGAHEDGMAFATKRHPGIGFPALRTDSEFNKGRCNGNQFETVPGLGDHLKRQAEAVGISTNGKYYCHGLAEFPGDPEAWVGSRGDVARVAEKKGFHVTGSVEYRSAEREPMKDVEIAPELVEREVNEVMAQDGGYRREDVAERVRDLRAARVDINPLCVDEAA